MTNEEVKQKLKLAWEELNKLGIYTEEQLDEANKNLVLDIGILGCRFTQEEIEGFRKTYRESKKSIS